MGNILNDLRVSADWIAGALKETGYGGDYSAESLWQVDRFLSEHASPGKARRGGPLATDLGAKLFALGAYVGEVIRRDRGGAWESSGDDAADEVNVALRLADGSVLLPVQRVMKRFQLGDEESLAAYALALGVPVGSPP